MPRAAGHSPISPVCSCVSLCSHASRRVATLVRAVHSAERTPGKSGTAPASFSSSFERAMPSAERGERASSSTPPRPTLSIAVGVCSAHCSDLRSFHVLSSESTRCERALLTPISLEAPHAREEEAEGGKPGESFSSPLSRGGVSTRFLPAARAAYAAGVSGGRVDSNGASKRASGLRSK
eukprot:scaffold56631_cov33-Tisochrysis_lutea.AAC.1